MAEFQFRYGQGEASLRLPDGLNLGVMRGKPMEAIGDVRAHLRERLDDPIGCAPLAPQARDKRDAMIVVSDYTRYNAYREWLPSLLNALNRAGLDDSAISLYIGSGTHRPMNDAEKLDCFGQQIIERVKLLDHDCDDTARLMKVGRTDYGTILWIDERVFNTELLIITGGIQYHYFAGYAGGRKAILPGCAGRESVEANHRRTLDPATGGFAERVEPGVLIGNPVSEDMWEAASLLKPDMCVNVVLNAEKEICYLNAGDYGYVHRIGAEFLDTHNKLKITKPADIAVISSGGYPKDVSLFQAHKGLRHTAGCLKPGGRVVWLAECTEGEGMADFAGNRDVGLDDFRRQIMNHISLGAFATLSLKTLTGKYDVHLVSSLPDAVVRAWGMTPHGELDSALGAATARLADNARWLIGPDMSNVLPVPAEQFAEHESELQKREQEEQAREARP